MRNFEKTCSNMTPFQDEKAVKIGRKVYESTRKSFKRHYFERRRPRHIFLSKSSIDLVYLIRLILV
jgi:hypothetical protein